MVKAERRRKLTVKLSAVAYKALEELAVEWGELSVTTAVELLVRKGAGLPPVDRSDDGSPREPVIRLSRRLRFEILKRDGFRCRYCGEAAPAVVLQVDHVVPRAWGGTDSAGNLVAACDECNLGKADVPLDGKLAAGLIVDRVVAGRRLFVGSQWHTHGLPTQDNQTVWIRGSNCAGCPAPDSVVTVAEVDHSSGTVTLESEPPDEPPVGDDYARLSEALASAEVCALQGCGCQKVPWPHHHNEHGSPWFCEAHALGTGWGLVHEGPGRWRVVSLGGELPEGPPVLPPEEPAGRTPPAFALGNPMAEAGFAPVPAIFSSVPEPESVLLAPAFMPPALDPEAFHVKHSLEPTPEPTAEPSPVPGPKAPAGAFVRSWMDANAPSWARAIGDSLAAGLDDLVSDEQKDHLRRWQQGEEV